MRIAKRYEFSASHQLNQLPADHPCSRLHGHNYTVEFEIEGECDARGFVIDYREIDKIVKPFIDETLDHHHLNDYTEQPTAENLAQVIYFHLFPSIPGLIAVTISETPKTWAKFTRS